LVIIPIKNYGDVVTNFLVEMYNKQIDLQKRIGSNFEDQQFIKDMTLAAIDELMEAIRETPWKPWKKTQEMNKENFKNEIIDVWHFVINLSISAGLSPKELYERFCEKNNENHKRQDRGY